MKTLTMGFEEDCVYNGQKYDRNKRDMTVLNRLLIILITPILCIPNIVFANGQDPVRESTVLYQLKVDATPAELKRFNALINPSTVLEKREIEGIAVYVAKIRNIKGFERAFSDQLMNTGAVKFAEPDALIPHAAEIGRAHV